MKTQNERVLWYKMLLGCKKPKMNLKPLIFINTVQFLNNLRPDRRRTCKAHHGINNILNPAYEVLS
jgi:hypothetical protein